MAFRSGRVHTKSVNYYNLLFDREHSDRQLQAAVFLEDAFWYRSINHKLDSLSLKWYRWYKSPIVNWFFLCVIFANLLQVFFEYPSSISISSDPRTPERNERQFELSCPADSTIEIILLIFLTIDFSIECFVSGWDNVKTKPWVLFYIVAICFSFVEMFVLISAFQCNQADDLGLRRMFRPFFLYRRSTTTKKILKSLAHTIPEVLSVLAMLLLHVIIFSLIGMMMFPSPKERYSTDSGNTPSLRDIEGMQDFPDIITSFISLAVLLSTANNPTVMMPAYNYSRLYSLFFIFFEFIALYCLMNMLTAIVYNQFSTYFLDSIKSTITRRRVALKACFEVLKKIQKGLSGVDGEPSKRSKGERFVDAEVIESAINRCQLRPQKKQVNVIKRLHHDGINEYDFDAFKTLVLSEWEMTSGTTVKPKYPKRRGTCRIFQKIALSAGIVYLQKAVTVLQALMIMTGVTNSLKALFNWITIDVAARKTLAYSNLAFMVFYLIYTAYLMWGMGFRRFFFNFGRLYDFVATVAVTITTIIMLIFYYTEPSNKSAIDSNFYQALRMLAILVLLKMFSLISVIQPMKLVATTLMDMVTHLQPYVSILMGAYYFYGCLGMVLFRGSIKFTAPGINNMTDIPANSSMQIVVQPCGTYEQQGYWGDNLDDFFAATVFLWNIMIVNNINVFLDIISRSASAWAQLYILVWWIFSNVILINLLVALILEIFMLRWSLFQEERVRRAALVIDSNNQELVAAHKYESIYDIFREGHHIVEPTDEELDKLLNLNPHTSAMMQNQDQHL